jgi:CPA2 family monovalent cation:H+ antiporter-2
MHGAHFLQALTITLSVAAVTTVLFQRLRQPVVLGYLAAGVIVGPHVSVPLWADASAVQTLSELGVILLFFTAGRLLGWTTKECLFAGAIVAISSTTIIAKTFDEQNIRGALRDRVVGVLVVEDLIAIVLMTVLTAVSSGSGLSGSALATTLGRLGAFLGGVMLVGLIIVPRLMRLIVKLGRPETTLVASVGLCFAVSLLAQKAGYSVALGAFLAGSLVAESGQEKEVEHLIMPVRDMFAAIFFVSVGMLIDPTVIVSEWVTVLVITLVVVLGKIISVSIGAFLTGAGVPMAVRAGMSQAQIGEFSFIIAGLGITLHATGNFLYPVAVAVSAITTLTTPWLVRASGPVASWLDRALPGPMQTFASLYASWLEGLGSAPRRSRGNTQVRRLVRLLVLDAGVLAAIVIGAAIEHANIIEMVTARLAVPARLATIGVFTGASVLAAPFAIGVVRVSRRLGLTLATMALPAAHGGGLDMAAAPRRSLVTSIEILIVLVVGAPLVAVTQPFLPGLPGAILLVAIILVLAIGFWRSATNLEGHVRAGAQVVVEALISQSRRAPTEMGDEPFAMVRTLLPGLGDLDPVPLAPGSPAVGQTLAQLNLRGLTGATVIAILRGDAGTIVPTADEVLRAGDVLALTGSSDAVEAARAILEAIETPLPLPLPSPNPSPLPNPSPTASPTASPTPSASPSASPSPNPSPSAVADPVTPRDAGSP